MGSKFLVVQEKRGGGNRQEGSPGQVGTSCDGTDLGTADVRGHMGSGGGKERKGGSKGEGEWKVQD